MRRHAALLVEAGKLDQAREVLRALGRLGEHPELALLRHAMMEPATRRHSSTALGISAGFSQMASQASRCDSSVMKALAVALEVVSCAAAMMAIIMERK